MADEWDNVWGQGLNPNNQTNRGVGDWSTPSENLDEKTKAAIAQSKAQADYYKSLADKADSPEQKKLLLAQANKANSEAALAEIQMQNFESPEAKRKAEAAIQLQIKDAEAASQMAVAQLHESGEAERLAKRLEADRQLAQDQFGHNEQLQRDKFGHDEALQKDQFTHAETLQGQQNDFTRGQDEMKEGGLNNRFRLGEQGATTRLQIEEGGKNRRTEAELGSASRGQDLQAAASRDKTMVDMISAQIEAGKLSEQKAGDMWNAYVQQKRLPSEIMKNVSDSIAPLVPYLTSYKKGDIPIGFQEGGPMDVTMQQAGSNYNPQDYAVNPVGINMFDLAKQAGANFNTKPLPDPGKLFGSVKVPNVPDPSTFHSATSDVGPLSSYIPQGGLQMSAEEKQMISDHLDSLGGGQ